jgi:hypothetical protein
MLNFGRNGGLEWTKNLDGLSEFMATRAECACITTMTVRLAETLGAAPHSPEVPGVASSGDSRDFPYISVQSQCQM